MSSNVYFKNESREKLMRGVSEVANAVKGTLGPAGHNVILEQNIEPYHIVTNDGVSIAQTIVMQDPVENIGANLAKEISKKADKESGDGTTTATVLLEAILQEGLKVEAHPMEIKRSLDECLPIIIKAIDDQKKEITVNDISKVATVSSESESLGKIFQEIYEKIGKDGIVELDNSNTFETHYEIKEGVSLRNCGYMAPYMVTEGTKAVYEKPSILIARQKITTIQELDHIFKQLNREGKSSIVIFCEDIDLNVLGALAFTHVNSIFKTLVIKAPTLWKDWIFEDFAKITGATIIGPESGTTFKTISTAHLGTCDKIITTKDETRVIGIKDVSEHIKQLEEDGKSNDQLLIRASWLKTLSATLKLGANSESELSYVRLKAQDAASACHYALKDGIVPGGGVALSNAASVLDQMDTIGAEILSSALVAPIYQIIRNAGADPIKVLSEGPDDETTGYNAKTGKLVNMWDANIVDPALVVKNAIKNAISVAGIVLTSQVTITIPNQFRQQVK